MESSITISLKECERLKEEAFKSLINKIEVKGEPSLYGVRITFPPETSSEVYRKVIDTFKDMNAVIDSPLGYSPELFVMSYDVRKMLAAHQDMLDAKWESLDSREKKLEERERKLKNSRNLLVVFWIMLITIYLILVWTN